MTTDPYGGLDPSWAWARYRARVSAAELVAMDAWHEKHGAFPTYPPDMWWACGYTAARGQYRSPYWWPLPGDRVYDRRTKDVRTVLAVKGPWRARWAPPTSAFTVRWSRPGYHKESSPMLDGWRKRFPSWTYGRRSPRGEVWPVRAPWLAAGDA